jgi:hypothetical protein
MSVVRSPVRSVVRSPVRSVFGGGDTQTDLQRLLALSPSLLIWPANGAGWQGTSGGTLAASGQPLGLGADLSQLGGKTLSEWLAAPTTSERVVNGSFAADSDWTKGADWSIGGGVATKVPGTQNSLSQTLTGITSGRVYVITMTVTLSAGTFNPFFTSVSLGNLTTSGTYTFVVADSGSSDILAIQGQVATSGSIDNISVRELPGNHLRAGTWATPSDAARGTFQNNAINFSGVDDYYSLLNAISITTNMTVVRAFKRASAGILSIGVGNTASNTRYDGRWGSDNVRSVSLGTAETDIGTANTATGSFVFTASRNASAQILRQNGTQLATGTPPTASGSFDNIGRRNTGYNSGEISFLAVFPTELTGANLTLVEQIAAGTNGATLS